MTAEQPEQPSEDELRAALEAELASVHVGDVIAQTIVSLINLGARRGGLAEVEESEIDPAQLALAIEGSRRLLPLIEEALGESANEIKGALSQLQMQFAQLVPTAGAPGGPGAPAGGEGAPKQDEGPGGGRLWVPGQ